MTRAEVLTDEMWARIEPLLPPLRGRGRPLKDHRLLVEGAIYRYRTGLAWRDLPAEFGPWQTVWKRHHRFATDGTCNPRGGRPVGFNAAEYKQRNVVERAFNRIKQWRALATRYATIYRGGLVLAALLLWLRS